MSGYDLIGKTGTASIFNHQTGKYYTGNYDYIYSFSGLYPGDDPELIIYMAIKMPKDNKGYVSNAVKDVVVNLSKYYNIELTNEVNDNGYMISDYINKNTNEIVKELNSYGVNTIILGNGNKIIGQYPNEVVTLYKGDKLVLLTNLYDKKMINFKGMSYKEANSILKLMNVEYELNGYGYVYEQNILADKVIDKKIILKLKNKY